MIGFGLHDLRRQFEKAVPEDRRGSIDSSFHELLTECEQVERSLRALVSSLEGGLAESISLPEAISDEVDNFKRRSAVAAELVVEGDPEAETDSQRIALQAVTREALSNVARHAQATLVVVTLAGGRARDRALDPGRRPRLRRAGVECRDAARPERDADPDRSARRRASRRERAGRPHDCHGYPPALAAGGGVDAAGSAPAVISTNGWW